jgi:hypothetical protein
VEATSSSLPSWLLSRTISQEIEPPNRNHFFFYRATQCAATTWAATHTKKAFCFGQKSGSSPTMLLGCCFSMSRRNNSTKHFVFLLLFSNAASLRSVVFN